MIEAFEAGCADCNKRGPMLQGEWDTDEQARAAYHAVMTFQGWEAYEGELLCPECLQNYWSVVIPRVGGPDVVVSRAKLYGRKRKGDRC